MTDIAGVKERLADIRASDGSMSDTAGTALRVIEELEDRAQRAEAHGFAYKCQRDDAQAEIERLREALEKILDTASDDHWDIARAALGQETPGKQEQPVNIASQEPPTSPTNDP